MPWAYRHLEERLHRWRDAFQSTNLTLIETELRALLVEIDVTRRIVQTELEVYQHTHQEADQPLAPQEPPDAA